MLRYEAEHSAVCRKRAETRLVSPVLSLKWAPGSIWSVGSATRMRELGVSSVSWVLLPESS